MRQSRDPTWDERISICASAVRAFESRRFQLSDIRIVRMHVGNVGDNEVPVSPTCRSDRFPCGTRDDRLRSIKLTDAHGALHIASHPSTPVQAAQFLPDQRISYLSISSCISLLEYRMLDINNIRSHKYDDF